MQRFLCFLVISAVTGWAVSEDGPVRAVLRIAQGEWQVFVGDSVGLSCSIPGDPSLQWRHFWFKDGVPIRHYGVLDDRHTLNALNPIFSGQYTCQGIMRYSNNASQEQSTLPSLPLHIHVAVGWVILQVSPQPAFVGDSMTLTCRVRRDPVLMEVVFYKDGTELQRSAQPKLHLAHPMQQDQGSYWCTATWKKLFYWTSAESLAVEVSVIDILSEPVMEAFPSGPVASGQVLSLKCSAQLTFPQPGLHLIYRYLQDGRRLGVATSQNKINMPLNVGLYQCKVTVGGLGITKWSNKVPVGIIHEEFAMTTNGPYSKTLPTSHHTETDTPTASGAGFYAVE